MSITKTKKQLSPVLTKLWWTVTTIFVYMLGKYIPLGTVVSPGISEGAVATKLFWQQLSLVTGGQFTSLSPFTLGLGPWMTSMILWRFLTLFQKIKALTSRQSHIYRMLLMSIVAFIQSFGFSAGNDYLKLSILGVYNDTILRSATMLVLIAGSFIIMWLGNLNAQKGLGGSTIIIISNMLLTFLVNLSTYFREENPKWSVLFWILFGVAILVGITVIVYRAEYRIPIRRIMIVSAFAEKTYLPIRLTPAGGMPFMYAMTLMSLPALVMRGLFAIYPDNPFLTHLASQLTLSQLPGILTYIVILGILAIGFAYFNTNPTDIAESMQKSGDYIEGIQPGIPTRNYITSYLNRLAIIGAIYTCVMGGLPLLVTWQQAGEVGIAMLVINIYIVSSLMLGIIEQIETLQSWKQYRQIF